MRFNLDMKYHRSKLFFIRNRVLILYCIVLFGWTFSIILGIIVANRIQAVLDEVRAGQKGNACILTLNPPRKKEEVVACIDKNKNDKNSQDNFKYNDSGSGSSPQQSSITLPPEKKTTLPPIKVTMAPPGVISQPKPEPQPIIKPVQTVTRKIKETRTTGEGLTECLYEGVTEWVIGDCR